MINTKEFYNLLKRKNIDFFTGVPDSLLKHFGNCIEDLEEENHIISTNEGSSVGLAIGYHLATNKIPLVYLQNSGLGNIVNPLLSLADKQVYSIPMLLIIGWRGEPETKDEPQHIKQGAVTIGLLETMGIPYKILSDGIDEADKQLGELHDWSSQNRAPAAILVRTNTFSPYKTARKEERLKVTRENAIKTIIDSIADNDLVISTTGKASRELFEVRKENKQPNNDFLTVGGMGHASQIALGIAKYQKDKTIYCIDGDGAALMHMGGLALIANSKAKNFCHVLINNAAHESVGGQPTLGDKVSFADLAKTLGYSNCLVASSEREIKEGIASFRQKNGPFLLEIICSSSSRESLGRPTKTPLENKIAFIEKIKQ